MEKFRHSNGRKRSSTKKKCKYLFWKLSLNLCAEAANRLEHLASICQY